MKLCIGTVQFGMDYGVQGGTRPAVEDAVRMLDFATQNGVDAIDTAAAYGTAEDVVGEFLSRKTLPRDAVQVISKFGTNIFEGASVADYAERLRAAAETSLRRIRSDYLDAYICHVPTAAGDSAIIEAMAALKASGYDGYLTIERECGEDQAKDMAEAVRFLREQLKCLA